MCVGVFLRQKTVVFVALLFVVFLIAIQTVSTATTIYVPDDYSTIQAAVDAASPGDTIIVRDGTYTENIDVNKDNLTIRSENGAEGAVIQAAGPNDHVFELTADYVEVSGFTVKGASGNNIAGIFLDARCSNIFDNILIENGIGIETWNSSSDNSIHDNNVYNNGGGIIVYYSSNSTIQNNTVHNNSWNGICVRHSRNSNISENETYANGGDGIDLGSCGNTVIERLYSCYLLLVMYQDAPTAVRNQA